VSGRLLIAVHDVAPAYLGEVRFLLRALDAIGAQPRVLKVIPEDLATDGELPALLLKEQAGGSEIVLHGYSHRTAGPLRGPWPLRVRARLFAPSDAEFLSLTAAETTERLRAGRERLAAANLAVTGFCAPAWLALPELPGVLRSLGFHYYVAMSTVVDLVVGRRVRTGWLGYMGSDKTQERLVGVANALTRVAAGRLPVIKVFLHPQGAVESAACRRVLAVIPQLMTGRRLVTYGQLVSA